MTNKEIINRNIGLTFDFLHQVLNNPALLNEIPDGTTIEFVEKDFSHVEKPAKKTGKRKYMRVKSELELIRK